jgi:hypothetical protein
MAKRRKRLPSSQLSLMGDAEAIRYLEQAIASGKHWYIALLEAIGLWSAATEVHNGRTYCYLVASEAFDWLLLAERLCEAVDGFLPAEDKLALLFYGKPPVDLSTKKFKELIGDAKYHQYLNYFYGITVEEALIWAVQDEVRKERRIGGYNGDHDTTNEVYRRIYGAARTALLKQFRQERGYPQVRSINLTELKEFTYWLFKYRLKQCEKAKVASDTKKALEQLRRHGASMLHLGGLTD